MRTLGRLVRFLGAIALLSIGGAALGQGAFPSKPVRFIVPYTPGSTPDMLVRLIGPKLTERWNQPVLVDLKPGGNTLIGTDALLKSPADGYTLMSMVMTHVITPQLFKVPYDPIKDFAPVATLVSTEQLLVVNPAFAPQNLRELIDLAKSKPGQLNYASVGAGGVTHLAMEFFSMLAGVKMQHVPYKGSVPALVDLFGGQVQMFLAIPSSVVEHIKAGKLRPIAISGNARSPVLPNVPTFTEAGLLGFNVTTWFGVLASAGTPKEVVEKLSGEINAVLAMPDIREKLLSQGVTPFISTPEQFGELMRNDLAKFGRVIKTANIKVE